MHTIMVANPKGGCGKSTLAIHLASWFAHCDEIVCLADLDRQQSSAEWLKRRPSTLPPIRAWASEDGTPGAPPRDCGVGILDTPAGLHGKALRQLLREVDRVIVPVAPSRFDMLASRDFFDELAETKAVRKDRVGVAIVGMRVDPRTIVAEKLRNFVDSLGLPVLGYLRNTQNYVQLAAQGQSVFDVAGTRVARDVEQWQGICDWLDAV